MELNQLLEDLPRAVRVVQAAKENFSPRVGIMLGSGLGEFATQIEPAVKIPYTKIPGFAESTVVGHEGHLVLGEFSGKSVCVMQGRYHFYEGHDMSSVTFPVRVLKRLGVETLILTAAGGGIDPRLHPGDFMLLEDHMNFMAENPLRGPYHAELGRRFPDMSEVYSPQLKSLARAAARVSKINLKKGIYAAMRGPSYETPAEIRMLRRLGASVVGMSIVPEAIVARQEQLNILGLVYVSNMAAGISKHRLSHKEVLHTGQKVGSKLKLFLKEIIRRI